MARVQDCTWQTTTPTVSSQRLIRDNEVLGLLMRKNKDQCSRYAINIRPHSTLEYKTTYRVLFRCDPVEGLASFGIPEEMAVNLTTQEEISCILPNYSH